jgi:anti-anti-sigma factor
MVFPGDGEDALGWDGHLLLLYRCEYERWSALADWVRRGFDRGEKVVYVEPAGSAAVERTFDRLCRTRPVSVLCQCARSVTMGYRLREVTTVHLYGVRERQLRTAATGGGLVLAGEVDISNDDLVFAAAQAATSRASAAFRLDLRGLAFLSVAGCRALEEGTERFRAAGGNVLVVGAGGIVRRVLRAVGSDALARFELAETHRNGTPGG